MFDSPDLTVIAPDGRRLAAEYVGFDGATGLSILRLADANLNISNNDDEKTIGEGQSIRVLNPEPAESKPLRGSLYVRMGTTSGTVLAVRRAPAGGGIARFKVRSSRLSSFNPMTFTRIDFMPWSIAATSGSSFWVMRATMEIRLLLMFTSTNCPEF